MLLINVKKGLQIPRTLRKWLKYFPVSLKKLWS